MSQTFPQDVTQKNCFLFLGTPMNNHDPLQDAGHRLGASTGLQSADVASSQLFSLALHAEAAMADDSIFLFFKQKKTKNNSIILKK